MALTLYGLKTCDTCRKALKALKEQNGNVSFVDVRDDFVSPHMIEMFHNAFGEALINTRSTTWRNMSAAEREGQPVAMLIEHPTLMKRPVIAYNGNLTLGWTKDVQTRLGLK